MRFIFDLTGHEVFFATGKQRPFYKQCPFHATEDAPRLTHELVDGAELDVLCRTPIDAGQEQKTVDKCMERNERDKKEIRFVFRAPKGVVEHPREKNKLRTGI